MFRSLIKVIIPMLLVGFIASDALAARKARATGFYRWQVGTIALPAQFVLEGPPGNNNIFLGFPNDDPVIDADVTLTGASPANFMLPVGAASGVYTAGLPIMGTAIVQIHSMFTIAAPGSIMENVMTGPGLSMTAYSSGGGPGNFSASGGPGSFSFCPGTVPGLPGSACPLTSMGAPDLAAPPQGTGTKNGRVVYMGGSGFGGVSQLYVKGSIIVSRARAGFGFGSPIFQVQQVPIGEGAATGSFRITGGPNGTTDTRPNPTNTFTQPRTAPGTNATIMSSQWGPQVTSMNALTACSTTGGATASTAVITSMNQWPNIPLTGSVACAKGSGPLLTSGAGVSSQTGFAFTTGTVLVQQTTNNTANGDGHLFSLTGTDSRTPKGIGNITMVSGLLASGVTANAETTSYQNTISITISEKAPSMTAGGFAAAAVLMVLAAGYGLRRRF